MKHKKFGFTLIEVALFLAVTGALFVAILVGTQNSIWQQRYNDATQSFANFVRNVYAEVSNPQSLGDGRSNLAIYGRLITFGESVGLDGEKIPNNEQRFFVYDVVGDASNNSEGLSSGPITEVLASRNANVIVEQDEELVPAGITTGYSPIWGSAIEETTDGGVYKVGKPYRGSILVVRHPGSGTIMTLKSDTVIEVNQTLKKYSDGAINMQGIRELLTSVLELGASDDDAFRAEPVNFCVNPYGVGEGGTLRRNIRILKNAHNASGVEIIDLDSEDNECRNDN